MNGSHFAEMNARQQQRSRFPLTSATSGARTGYNRFERQMSAMPRHQLNQKVHLRESQIEDVLATYPEVAQQLAGSDQQFRLLGRQMPLPSGRLDLLFSAGSNLVLIELKVEPCQLEFVDQVKTYTRDLNQLQSDGALITAPIDSILLCPSFGARQERACLSDGITPVTYSPEQVLQAFHQRIRSLAQFVSMRPSDHGLWSIHLIHRVLYALGTRDGIASLAAATGLSPKSVANHLRFAEALHLTTRIGGRFFLTSLGERYVKARSAGAPSSFMSEEQADIIRSFVVKDPFASPVIFGIYLIVDALFTLSRNGYPVQWAVLSPYFRDTAGKRFEWSAPTTEHHGLRMYSNYAIELGLLGRVGEDLYLTPDGLRFILLLQLHKSIKMLDAIHP